MNTISPGALLTIIIIMIGLGILIYGISALERYKRLWAAIGWYLRSLMYTAYGIVISAVVFGIYLISTSVAAVAGTVDPLVYVYVVGGYIGVTLLGYGGYRAYLKVKEMHEASKRELQPLAPGAGSGPGTD